MKVTQEQLAQFASIKVETTNFKPLKQSTIDALYSKIEPRSYKTSGTSLSPWRNGK
jgi:hypothetical protein